MLNRPCALAGGLVFLLAGCSKPELVPPAPFQVAAKLGDDAGAPVVKHTLHLGVSPPDASVRWSSKTDSRWIRLSPKEGGAPVDLEMSFDMDALGYGPNAGTVLFESGKKVIPLQVSYSLTGWLRTSPSQTIELKGKVGEAETGAVELHIDSEAKAGLPWTLHCDDPWIVASETTGRTPSVVRVSAKLGSLTQSVVGRMTIEAPLAWRGSPTTLPVSITLLDVALVKKQVESKCKKITAEIEALSKEVMRPITELEERDDLTIDQAAARMKAFGQDAKAMTSRVLPLLDDLEAFLEQQKVYEIECAFSQERKFIGDHRKDLESLESRARRVSDGSRLVRVNIRSDAEWQRVEGINLKKGMIVFVECKGQWSLGGFAGTCDGEGGTGYTDYCVVEDQPFGALLLRSGDEVLLSGSGEAVVGSSGGRLEARCNDTDYGNNSGSIRLAVLIIPNLD